MDSEGRHQKLFKYESSTGRVLAYEIFLDDNNNMGDITNFLAISLFLLVKSCEIM